MGIKPTSRDDSPDIFQMAGSHPDAKTNRGPQRVILDPELNCWH
jgi:hypothetical protein